MHPVLTSDQTFFFIFRMNVVRFTDVYSTGNNTFASLSALNCASRSSANYFHGGFQAPDRNWPIELLKMESYTPTFLATP